MPSSGEPGNQIECVVLALLDALLDKNEAVSRSVSNSLVTIGRGQPELVLSSCLAYFHRNKKLPNYHRILLLNVMDRICVDSMSSIHKGLIQDIIKLASEEMTSTKDVVLDWQTAASCLLVSIGQKFLEEVMEQLNLKFQPGVLPHVFTVQTLANLAVANVFQMVPFLKAILGTMLPMLGMIKQENMKLAFSYALARFAESITDYLANLEKAPDPSVRKEVFSTELGNAYDVLFSNWLQSRDSKVRSEVVEALGHMTRLLSKEKMDEQLQRVIPGILGLYKRQPDVLSITEGLCMVLSAAVESQSASLEVHLDNILNILFPQVCGLPDYSQPTSVKNHNEVLRCFTVLMSHPSLLFCDRLVTYILQRLENNNERNRIGALSILRHLINSSEFQITEKIPAIVSTLKIITGDPNNKVKKVLAQVIVALAHHGHLELEGCDCLVSFLVQQCALPEETGKRPANSEPDYVSNEALRGMCDNVLHLLTTTVDKMEKVLWPYLFECLVPEDLTPAVGVMCRSIAYLANKKRDERNPDFEIDFAKRSNVPKPPVLLSRLVVLLGHPMSGHERGVSILRCMKAISPLIDKSLTALWDTLCPQLLLKLEGPPFGGGSDGEPWDQNSWEESLLQLVSRSLEEIDREDWTLKFGKAILSHLPLYNTNSHDKFVLLRVLGIVLKRVSNKQFVNSALDTIFEGVQHSHPLEREGCSIAAGYCGAAHLDAVLVKLEQVVKEDQKRNSGIFSFIMDFRGVSEQDSLKATVILTYGHLSVYAPATILTTRIETPMLRSVANFCQSSRELCVRQSMLETIRLMGHSLHPDQLKQAFVFPSRNELLLQMQTILRAEGNTFLINNIRCLALKAAASLLSLDPVLGSQERTVLIQTCVSCVYPLPLECREEGEEVEDYGQLLVATLEALDALLQQLLLKERTTGNLNFIIKVLRPWLMSHHEHERDRCIESVLWLLKLFLEKHDNATFSVFTTLGSVLGVLLPRCTDPKASVRSSALLCVRTVLVIMGKGQYQSVEDTSLSSLKDLEKLTIHDDPSSLFTITNELAKVMCKKVSLEQLAPLLEMLTEALSDNHSLSSSGASVILNGIVKARGNELRAEVPHLVESLQHQLESITCAQTCLGTRCVLRSLASHHLSPLLGTLLNSPLPFAKQVVESWREVSREVGLGRNIMEHLLEILSEEQLIESLSDARNNKMTISVAALHPLSAMCALREVFRVSEMEVHCKEQFDRIFSSLLLVTGTYVGAYQPADPANVDRKNDSSMARLFIEKASSKLMPVRCAIETFKSFLLCSRQDVIVNFLTENGYWTIMEDEEKYPDAMAALARSLCIHWPHQVPRIVSHLNNALNSPYEAQRITTIAVFAELLSQSYEGNQTLTEPLVNSLLSHLVDSSKSVRRLCIKGLGTMGNLDKDEPCCLGHPEYNNVISAFMASLNVFLKSQGSEEAYIGVHRYSTTVLSAMMAGMDDKDDPEQDITLEAMSGLSSVLAQVDEEDVRDILVNITLRIRPMFEKEKAPVRAAAFNLFGNLSRFGSGPSREAFVEQVQSNLVTLLVYLNDDNQSVIKSCKHALRQLGPLLGSSGASTMFQKHLLDKAQLHYGEFIKDLTKTFIADFPQKTSFYVNCAFPYLKSSRSIIQCNAAILLGFLLSNYQGDKQANASKDKVCSSMQHNLPNTSHSPMNWNFKTVQNGRNIPSTDQKSTEKTTRSNSHALVVMLKDSTPEVRMKAAEALSLLL